MGLFDRGDMGRYLMALLSISCLSVLLDRRQHVAARPSGATACHYVKGLIMCHRHQHCPVFRRSHPICSAHFPLAGMRWEAWRSPLGLTRPCCRWWFFGRSKAL
jgi:hypothetical protein